MLARAGFWPRAADDPIEQLPKSRVGREQEAASRRGFVFGALAAAAHTGGRYCETL
jgi:hypothetical protein